VLAVPPGGKSDFMPEVYKALYTPGLGPGVAISGLA